jgi:hypothetical protein
MTTDHLERAAIYLGSLVVVIAVMNELGTTDAQSRIAACFFAYFSTDLICAARGSSGD